MVWASQPFSSHGHRLKQGVLQTGPGLWTAILPFTKSLPLPLSLSDALLILVAFAACQQAGGQISRTLSGKSVCAALEPALAAVCELWVRM